MTKAVRQIDAAVLHRARIKTANRKHPSQGRFAKGEDMPMAFAPAQRAFRYPGSVYHRRSRLETKHKNLVKLLSNANRRAALPPNPAHLAGSAPQDPQRCCLHHPPIRAAAARH